MEQFSSAGSPNHRPVWNGEACRQTRGRGYMSRTRWKVLTIMLTALLGAGLFLAYDASRHTESRYDVSITLEVQGWDVPGLDGVLEFVSELTNLLPGVVI